MGEYVNYRRASVCNQSLPGWYVPFTGQNESSPCPPGSYSNTYGATLCLECGASDFNPKYNSSMCGRCETNSYPNAQKTACQCEIGYYAYDNTTDADTGFLKPMCKQCSNGMICDVPGLTWENVLPQKG